MLIIINGHPATGKTTIAKQISSELKIPLVTRDAIKELIFDNVGIKDREWSKKVGGASYDIFFHLIDELLKNNKDLIIDSPLKAEFDNQRFQDLQKKYNTQMTQILCYADGQVLLDRFIKRSNSDERHPGHVDHNNTEEFKEGLLKGKRPALDLEGKIFEVDTTDFSKIDLTEIINYLKRHA